MADWLISGGEWFVGSGSVIDKNVNYLACIEITLIASPRVGQRISYLAVAAI